MASKKKGPAPLHVRAFRRRRRGRPDAWTVVGGEGTHFAGTGETMSAALAEFLIANREALGFCLTIYEKNKPPLVTNHYHQPREQAEAEKASEDELKRLL
jgi:hypothetical protein